METFLYLSSAVPCVVLLLILYSFLDWLAESWVKYLKCGHRMDLFVLSGLVPFSEVWWRIVRVYINTALLQQSPF